MSAGCTFSTPVVRSKLSSPRFGSRTTTFGLYVKSWRSTIYKSFPSAPPNLPYSLFCSNCWPSGILEPSILIILPRFRICFALPRGGVWFFRQPGMPQGLSLGDVASRSPPIPIIVLRYPCTRTSRTRSCSNGVAFWPETWVVQPCDLSKKITIRTRSCSNGVAFSPEIWVVQPCDLSKNIITPVSGVFLVPGCRRYRFLNECPCRDT